MQQYLTYLCTDINETGLSLAIFLRNEQFYVVCFFFCRVYIELIYNLGDKTILYFIFNHINGFVEVQNRKAEQPV